MALTSEPAPPILAHSLLPESTSIPDSNLQPNPWNLQEDLDRGFHRSSIFRPGTTIGFSKLKTSTQNTTDDEFIAQVPRSILTTHLRQTPSSQSPRAFIIHPASSNAFSPRKLLEELLSTSARNHQPLSREEAISRLDAVQLFPVFDFAAAVHAIAEVSDRLRGLIEPQTGDPVLLIVVGLDTLAEGVVRASNTVRGAAVLTTALRELEQMARVYASAVSVSLVNTSGLGSDGAVGEVSRGRWEDGVRSGFGEMALMPGLLMRTLDQGVDLHVLVAWVEGDVVVEVVKDRVGDGGGRWCVRG